MKTIKCEFCETHLRKDEVINFEGISMSPSCLNERTRICEWCNERIWADDNYGNDHIFLCRYCYD